MSADPRLMKMYLKNLLAALEAKSAEQPQHCKRADGSFRRWAETAEDMAAFIAAHPETYGSDVVTLCGRCGYFHASHPSWLPHLPWETEVTKLVAN
jgi:heterodisulfide reductase subunit B